ncbi:MAG: 2-oxoacid:ferredoxin oxidoreductase subunit beta, partial [Alphaproteobacteria bacterium]
MNIAPVKQDLKPADFVSGQDVRWCPGCGDYAILKAVQRTMPELGIPRENVVFVSGIGCAARFPYYMETYGFHTIHGRAPAIATGVKLANPELSVWVISGDGDALSIGGNHTLHLLRRNVDVQFLLFNNEVYGLTKGQYSPTSKRGFRSPSTPAGSLDAPVNPCSFALGAGGRFVARAYDVQQKVLPDILKRAAAFRGAAFVEILQNCIVYHDGAFADVTNKKTAADFQVQAVHGEKLVFGAERDKGLRFNPQTFALEVVRLGEDGVSEEDILVHDETNPALAAMLARLSGPEFPMVMGVLYCAPGEDSYERAVQERIERPSPGEARERLRSLL